MTEEKKDNKCDNGCICVFTPEQAAEYDKKQALHFAENERLHKEARERKWNAFYDIEDKTVNTLIEIPLEGYDVPDELRCSCMKVSNNEFGRGLNLCELSFFCPRLGEYNKKKREAMLVKELQEIEKLKEQDENDYYLSSTFPIYISKSDKNNTRYYKIIHESEMPKVNGRIEHTVEITELYNRQALEVLCDSYKKEIEELKSKLS